jgi:hypothetical protein
MNLPHQNAALAVEGEGSIAGESVVVHPDVEDLHDVANIGFNMERFLRDTTAVTQTSSTEFAVFQESVTTTEEPIESNPMPDHQQQSSQGPIMERFLNEPILMVSDELTDAATMEHPVQQDALDPIALADPTTDLALDPIHHADPVGGDYQSVTSLDRSADADYSTHVQVDDDDNDHDDDELPQIGPFHTPATSMDLPPTAGFESDHHDVPLADSASVEGIIDGGSHHLTPEDDDDDDESTPVLGRGLTEAEIQTMAEIEAASIGNAPPSDRDDEDLSEIGELADFGGMIGGGGLHHGAFSQGTVTTAMESASLTSEFNSSSALQHRPALESDSGHVEDGPTASEALVVPGHERGSSSASASIPSHVLASSVDDHLSTAAGATDDIPVTTPDGLLSHPSPAPTDHTDLPADSSFPLLDGHLPTLTTTSPIHQPRLEPPTSPLGNSAALTPDQPEDGWSAGGTMHVSPLASSRAVQIDSLDLQSVPLFGLTQPPPYLHDYGAVDRETTPLVGERAQPPPRIGSLDSEEATPLLVAQPSIGARSDRSEAKADDVEGGANGWLSTSLTSSVGSENRIFNMASLSKQAFGTSLRNSVRSMQGQLDSVISDIRSIEEDDRIEYSLDADRYKANSVLSRGKLFQRLIAHGCGLAILM